MTRNPVDAIILQPPPSAFSGRLRPYRARELAQQYAAAAEAMFREAEAGGPNAAEYLKLAIQNERRARGAAAVIAPLVRRQFRAGSGCGTAA